MAKNFAIFIMNRLFRAIFRLWFLFNFAKHLKRYEDAQTHIHTNRHRRFRIHEMVLHYKWMTKKWWWENSITGARLGELLSFIVIPCSCSHIHIYIYINRALYVWLVKSINMGVCSVVKPTATLINTSSKYHRRRNTQKSNMCVCVYVWIHQTEKHFSQYARLVFDINQFTKGKRSVPNSLVIFIFTSTNIIQYAIKQMCFMASKCIDVSKMEIESHNDCRKRRDKRRE